MAGRIPARPTGPAGAGYDGSETATVQPGMTPPPGTGGNANNSTELLDDGLGAEGTLSGANPSGVVYKFEIPLKPQAKPVDFPPSFANVVEHEYATRFLEKMGAEPSAQNVNVLLKEMPISSCKVTAAWRSRGWLSDTLFIVPQGRNRGTDIRSAALKKTKKRRAGASAVAATDDQTGGGIRDTQEELTMHQAIADMKLQLQADLIQTEQDRQKKRQSEHAQVQQLRRDLAWAFADPQRFANAVPLHEEPFGLERAPNFVVKKFRKLMDPLDITHVQIAKLARKYEAELRGDARVKQLKPVDKAALWALTANPVTLRVIGLIAHYVYWLFVIPAVTTRWDAFVQANPEHPVVRPKSYGGAGAGGDASPGMMMMMMATTNGPESEDDHADAFGAALRGQSPALAMPIVGGVGNMGGGVAVQDSGLQSQFTNSLASNASAMVLSEQEAESLYVAMENSMISLDKEAGYTLVASQIFKPILAAMVHQCVMAAIKRAYSWLRLDRPESVAFLAYIEKAVVSVVDPAFFNVSIDHASRVTDPVPPRVQDAYRGTSSAARAVFEQSSCAKVRQFMVQAGRNSMRPMTSNRSSQQQQQQQNERHPDEGSQITEAVQLPSDTIPNAFGLGERDEHDAKGSAAARIAEKAVESRRHRRLLERQRGLTAEAEARARAQADADSTDGGGGSGQGSVADPNAQESEPHGFLANVLAGTLSALPQHAVPSSTDSTAPRTCTSASGGRRRVRISMPQTTEPPSNNPTAVPPHPAQRPGSVGHSAGSPRSPLTKQRPVTAGNVPHHQRPRQSERPSSSSSAARPGVATAPAAVPAHRTDMYDPPATVSLGASNRSRLFRSLVMRTRLQYQPQYKALHARTPLFEQRSKLLADA